MQNSCAKHELAALDEGGNILTVDVVVTAAINIITQNSI